MYVVRETLTAKPGMASKLASMFQNLAQHAKGRCTMRVLTDVVGPFNTVVFETEVSEIGEFERIEKELTSKPEVREIMKGHTDAYVTGRREIYRVFEGKS